MFVKQGSPQPFKVASTICEICGKEKATMLVNGQMVCNSCASSPVKE